MGNTPAPETIPPRRISLKVQAKRAFSRALSMSFAPSARVPSKKYKKFTVNGLRLTCNRAQTFGKPDQNDWRV
jgi:hypothetical protein